MELETNVPETMPDEVTAPPISGTDTASPAETAPETVPEAAPVELIEVPERLIFTTPLADYSVTEGLLLLIFVLLLCRSLVALVKEVVS